MPPYKPSPISSPSFDPFYDSHATPRPGDYQQAHAPQPSHGLDQNRPPPPRTELPPLPLESPIHITFPFDTINPFEKKLDKAPDANECQPPISPATVVRPILPHHAGSMNSHHGHHPHQAHPHSILRTQPSRPNLHHQPQVAPPLQRQHHSFSTTTTSSRTPVKIGRTASGFFRPSPSTSSVGTNEAADRSDSSFSSVDSLFDPSLLTPGTTPIKTAFPLPPSHLIHHNRLSPTHQHHKDPIGSTPSDPFAPTQQTESYDDHRLGGAILPSESSGLIYLSERDRDQTTTHLLVGTAKAPGHEQPQQGYMRDRQGVAHPIREGRKVPADRGIRGQGALIVGKGGYLRPAGALEVRIRRGKKWSYF